MAIPEAQLITWANQGAVATAKMTHESVRHALAIAPQLAGKGFDVFLQGSYRNDTNIRGDSDVDIVVQLDATFHYDTSSLDPAQLYQWAQAYPTRAAYLWEHFRVDVLASLRAHYGNGAVHEGRNALSVAAGGGRLSADVVVVTQYRNYRRFMSQQDQQWVEGVAFYTMPGLQLVINYPKPHYDNGVAKNAANRTNGWYKPAVRMMKNARTHLVGHGQLADRIAPSYFVECLLYNVPDAMFGSSFHETYYNSIKWLLGQDMAGFVCQNGQLGLFGPTAEQWSIASASAVLNGLASLWDNW